MIRWRGAGVVELATLERWYTGNGIVGSNPTLSAIWGVFGNIPNMLQDDLAP